MYRDLMRALANASRSDAESVMRSLKSAIRLSRRSDIRSNTKILEDAFIALDGAMGAIHVTQMDRSGIAPCDLCGKPEVDPECDICSREP